MTNHIIFEPMAASHAKEIALIHIQGIGTGFISSLGPGFVTELYEAIAKDSNSFGFVAIEDGKALGFIALSTNLGKLYKYVALKKGFKFGLILARRMLSFRVFKKVIDNIFYPIKMKKLDLPDAELLSIVVVPEARGKGIAKQLIEKHFEECKKRGINRVKALVRVENEAANKLYLKCGFELKKTIKSHGFLSNIYITQSKCST